MATITKETGISISLSAVAAIIGMIPVLWFIARPILVSSVSTAMADDIEDTIKTTVQEEVAPLKSGFRVLLLQDINKMRTDIAVMRLRERNDPGWSVDDAEDLVDLQSQLEATQAALNAMGAQ